MILVQLRRGPIHFRAVGRSLLRNHNVAAFGKQTPEAVEHAVAATNHVIAKGRVDLIEPSGQTDAARDRIDLGDGVAGFRQNEIGPDDERNVVAELFLAGELDQLGGFTGVEVRGDPGGLFAFDALLVKLVARALENEKAMAELLEFLSKFFVDRKRIGRKEKILFSEKALLGEGGSNRGEFVWFGVHWQRRGAARLTSNA